MSIDEKIQAIIDNGNLAPIYVYGRIIEVQARDFSVNGLGELFVLSGNYWLRVYFED